jgi:hypothetical protein
MGRGGQRAGTMFQTGSAECCQGLKGHSTLGKKVITEQMLLGSAQEGSSVIERCHLSDLQGKSEPSSLGESVVPTGQ